MSKSYIFLIAILVILAIAIGGFAFYRAATRGQTTAATTTLAPQTPSITPAPTPTSPATSPDDHIATQSNTLALTISSPTDNLEVTTPTITVSGTTAAGSDVAVNDRDLKADAKGRFTTTVALEVGVNYILIVASNADGASEKTLTVTYTPSQ